jgi:hypothetical protein
MEERKAICFFFKLNHLIKFDFLSNYKTDDRLSKWDKNIWGRVIAYSKI